MRQQKISLILVTLLACSLSFSITPWFHKAQPQLTVNCIDALPYPKVNINYNTYLSWYGKVGEQLNGTTYDSGHVFSRHIAVNHLCTAEQKKDNKTVFYDESQFYKALNKDTTNCTLTSTTAFNFNQNHNIASASDYIRGIDCVTGNIHLFSSYFVEYKRAIQNSRPTQAQYMASQKATIWTFYPKR